MANIAILNYCNLQCPYCFANKFITEEEKELITDEQLDKILDFLSNSAPGNRIGIIGGEPTIHPNFREIITKIDKFSQEHNFIPPTVFSNGILLGDFVDCFKDARCLVNVNSPEIIGETNWNKLVYSLKRFEAYGNIHNITLGINLYPEMPDFNYIFDLAIKFRIPTVRCSYVAPTCKFSEVDKETYYTAAKPLFLEFIRTAAEKHIKINLDCNNIPACYFSSEELELVEETVIDWRSYCMPVIDISPDMKATACFGAYNLVDIEGFASEAELHRYLAYKELYARNINNNSGRCSDCEKFEKMTCQGGCLAFAKKDTSEN